MVRRGPGRVDAGRWRTRAASAFRTSWRRPPECGRHRPTSRAAGPRSRRPGRGHRSRPPKTQYPRTRTVNPAPRAPASPAVRRPRPRRRLSSAAPRRRTRAPSRRRRPPSPRAAPGDRARRRPRRLTEQRPAEHSTPVGAAPRPKALAAPPHPTPATHLPPTAPWPLLGTRRSTVPPPGARDPTTAPDAEPRPTTRPLDALSRPTTPPPGAQRPTTAPLGGSRPKTPAFGVRLRGPRLAVVSRRMGPRRTVLLLLREPRRGGPLPRGPSALRGRRTARLRAEGPRPTRTPVALGRPKGSAGPMGPRFAAPPPRPRTARLPAEGPRPRRTPAASKGSVEPGAVPGARPRTAGEPRPTRARPTGCRRGQRSIR